jgi:glycosyltransferase involved in cell wall biosynthesis
LKNNLISIPWFSPAFKAGGPVQSVLNMVNNIGGDIEFDVVTSDRDIDGAKLKIQESDKWVHFKNNTKVFYCSVANRFSRLLEIFKNKKSDVDFLTGIYSFHFTILPVLFSRSKRKIISVRGMLHPPALQQKRFKKKIYLSILKPLLLHKRVEFHATDESEKQHIISFIGHQPKIWVAANIPTIIEQNILPKKKGVLKLLTVALIGPMKNHLEVLNALATCGSSIEYDICGPIYWPDYWQKCSEVISKLPSNIKVNYHGAIPPLELVTFYHQSHVFICPSQSENFGHAIFEAFSAGKPVITSHNTPWNQLEEKKIGLNIHPEKGEINNAIMRFADMDESTYKDWSIKAAEFARDQPFIDEAKRSYEKMFANVK